MTLTPEVAAHVTAVLNVAHELARLDKEVRLSFGVDDAMSEAIGTLAGARRRATVYMKDTDPPYVIESFEVTLGRVTLRAQKHDRPPTDAELEGAASWTRVNAWIFRCGDLL